MRTSKDIWKLVNGEFIALSQSEAPPDGAVIWSGYDYHAQRWVNGGKPDIRTIEELRQSVEKRN